MGPHRASWHEAGREWRRHTAAQHGAMLRLLAKGLRPSTPLVAIVNLRGVIGAPARGRKPLNCERAAAWLDRAFGLRPEAVAVRINSPGGSPAQTELLVDAIRERADRTGVDVVCFADDAAASGGYWLLAGAASPRKPGSDCGGCYAMPTSVVGSIGVVSPSFGAVGALQRLGLERRVWTAGEAKAGVDPFKPVDPEAEARLKDVLEDLHSAFIGAVIAARGAALPPESPARDAELFSGRVWTGRQALKLGLVDGLGTVHAVLRSRFGAATRFVDCGEHAVRGGLFGICASGAVDGALAVAEERATWARVGV